MIVADTSAWIGHLRGTATPAARALGALLDGPEDIGLTDLVYAELLVGAADDLAAGRMGRDLALFPIITQIPLDDHVLAAKLRRDARAAGTPVRGIVDCLIAAACIRMDLPLLHDDRDFDRLAACSPLRVVTLADA